MITISVDYAALGRRYDFNADENAPIRQLTEDMVSSIAQLEHLEQAEAGGLFLLCNPETRQIYAPATTLLENGIQSGAELLLV